MISRFFIDRPISAWVLAIIVMLVGIGGIASLPIAQYPDIAPPQIVVRATYPGASAEVLQSTVTTLIEEQLTGITGMIYFSSSSSNAGTATINISFEKGADPEIAQVQVQNKVQQAISRLPEQVQRQGLIVDRTSPDSLLILALYDESNRTTNYDIADYLVSHMQDRLARLPGVGDYTVFGAQYAIRIWLDPTKLAGRGLMPSDVTNAISAQNTQVASGQIGMMPSRDGQMLTATITSRSRFTRLDQFPTIVLKTQGDGSKVLLRDVGRVEMGAETYNTLSTLNGHPAAGMSIVLAPGFDALTTAERVKKTVAEMTHDFPPGYKIVYPLDSTEFIRISVSEVVKTLIISIILVVIVIFVFLQSWRATIVPTIAVPIVLLGTFGILWMIGYSINTLTLFAMVLAIGLLVDDAIVVVENIERVIEDDPEMSVHDATVHSMNEIQVALISIAIVLSAVFLPLAFFGGSVGVIYRQFSITIVSAMILSALIALTLTPAISAKLLRHKTAPSKPATPARPRAVPIWLSQGHARFGHWLMKAGKAFNASLTSLTRHYAALVEKVIGIGWWLMLFYGAILACLMVLFVRLPTSFLPVEDQGYALALWNLPPGATIDRSQAAGRAVENYFRGRLGHNVQAVYGVAGQNTAGVSQNTGFAYIAFKSWDQRTGKLTSVPDMIDQANQDLNRHSRDAQYFLISPPSVSGFGRANGFTFELLNSSMMDFDDFVAKRDQLMRAAAGDPRITGLRLTGIPMQPGVKIDFDTEKIAALQIDQNDVNQTLSAAFGSSYVNDFTDRGRVKRVYIQGDAQYRDEPSDLDLWHVRSANGDMAPLSAVATLHWNMQPVLLTHYNGLPSFEFMGLPAAGLSSGDAMQAITDHAAQIPGIDWDWSALSFQEKATGGQAPLLYALSLIVIFLCLAALYESWTVPFAVLLIIPLGLFGAALAMTLRGLPNDIYFQVGLLTTMGLAAKNAILIIEFAVAEEARTGNPVRAAIDASSRRLRPILMTSVAFLFGVFPLAIATGAGALSRVEIGTAVIGGMLAATTLELFLVPAFFVLLRRLFPARGRPANDGQTVRSDPGGAA